jgi:hypothetical protein
MPLFCDDDPANNMMMSDVSTTKGRIRLSDQGPPWQEQHSGAVVRTTHMLLVALGLGLLISFANLVAAVVLLITQDGKSLHSINTCGDSKTAEKSEIHTPPNTQ